MVIILINRGLGFNVLKVTVFCSEKKYVPWRRKIYYFFKIGFQLIASHPTALLFLSISLLYYQILVNTCMALSPISSILTPCYPGACLPITCIPQSTYLTFFSSSRLMYLKTPANQIAYTKPSPEPRRVVKFLGMLLRISVTLLFSAADVSWPSPLATEWKWCEEKSNAAGNEHISQSGSSLCESESDRAEANIGGWR